MPKHATDIAVKKGKTAVPATTESVVGLRNAIDDVFDRFFTGSPLLAGRSLWDPFQGLSAPFRNIRSSLQSSVLSPRADVEETDKAYEISVELPGIDEKNISLEVSDDMLTLKGEKKSEHEEKKKDYHLSERSYGSFYRSFRIPGNVKADAISADFLKGVLKVTLPKTKNAQKKSKKISVTAK